MAVPNAIPCFSWTTTKGSPRAVLLCIHGLGLHGGTYRPFGEQMARLGVATYALDVRGFGGWCSNGPDSNTCILNLPQCLEDIQEKINELRQIHPGLPIFLLGESLGGAISTRFAADFEDSLDGLILCAPARTLGDHKLEILLTLIRFVLRPTRKVSIVESIFRHSPNVMALKNLDPYIRTEFSPRELVHLCGFLRSSGKALARIKHLPVLFVQGKGDMLITPKRTLAFFESIPSTDKDLMIIGDAQHLIFQHTMVPRKVIALVDNWIMDHLPQQDRPKKPRRRSSNQAA